MTKLYGLAGYPVRHSFSAGMHNAAFRSLGIDAEYRLFEVRADELGEFFSVFKHRLSGVNITIPHKEASIDYLDRLDDTARSIGAVNTVVLEKGGLVGYNTDAAGFIKSLKEDLNFDPSSKKVFIFGAGGASRAVSFGLLWEKAARIVLADIDKEKAAALAGDLKEAGCDAAALGKDETAVKEVIRDSDLLVNASPCGMREGDPEVLDYGYLHKGLSVFDLIYNPNRTPLIEEAKKRSIKGVNGLGMLLYQGAAAFELWTGRPAPIDTMRRALRVESRRA